MVFLFLNIRHVSIAPTCRYDASVVDREIGHFVKGFLLEECTEHMTSM